MSVENLKVDDVISLQVLGGLPGIKGSPLFQQTDDNGKAVITKIVGWLNQSKAATGATQFGKHGYPMVINLKMSNGKVAVIEPAYNCTITTNKDGSGTKTCTPVKGEIVLSQDSKSIRLISSEVYEWLQDGWKHEQSFHLRRNKSLHNCLKSIQNPATGDKKSMRILAVFKDINSQLQAR